jgi:stigma-specific protein Stig1
MNEEPRERSFDELAKGLASGEVSRGKALRLMGAALVAGALGAMPGVAFARTPPTRGGSGPCPTGRTNCRGKCYDLTQDRNNCGQCGNVCAESQLCQGGTCLGTCSPGQAGCGQNLCRCPERTHCIGLSGAETCVPEG